MLLPALLALVLTAGTAPPPDGTDDLDIDAARGGLARIAEAYADWPAGRPLPDCPLLGRDAINATLGTAGVDARLERWELEATKADPPTVSCGGQFVGTGEESFPDVWVRLGALDLGDAAAVDEYVATALPDAGEPIDAIDAEGGSVGECVDEDLADVCVELWHREGFAVAITIQDRVFVDRPTTATVLADIVPDVVATLAGESTDAADPLSALSDDAVTAAAVGLDRFIDAVDAAEATELACPAIDHEDFAAALADAGVEPSLAGWDASIDPVFDQNEFEDVEPPPVVLTCSGESRVGAELEAALKIVDFDDAAAAEDFVASVGLAEGGSAGDLPPGEVTVGSCQEVSSARFCSEWWWRDGFVVGVWLYSETESIRRDDVKAVLVDVVPLALDNLSRTLPRR
ncbi:MAG: hypothetical protein ACRD0G_19340 [Acidimicrobiales bacterium]